MTIDQDAARAGGVVALMGATATGKTSVALGLAERIDAEIVNCDALQVYQGLEIGTAKPTAEERARVPHHLFDVVDPRQRFSAGEYASAARETIDLLTLKGNVILVGGTGLYYRALVSGIAEIPVIPEEIRVTVRERAAREGQLRSHARLSNLDPETASKIAATDPQRTLRALEVLAATGKGQAQWIAEQPKPKIRWALERFLLTRERSLLYDRIERRTKEMLDGGWIDEVRGLLASGTPMDAPAFQAIGYRQIIELLHGSISEAEALNQIRVSTRRYAKRQETWFRKEPGFRPIIAGDDPDTAVDAIADSLSFHHFSSGGSQ